MKIKNLAQLKKALTGGAKFYIQNHWKEDNIGQTRTVNIVQSNGIYTIIEDDDKHPISNANQGKGSWLDWGKASDWEFVDDACGVTHCILKNHKAQRPEDALVMELVVLDNEEVA